MVSSPVSYRHGGLLILVSTFPAEHDSECISTHCGKAPDRPGRKAAPLQAPSNDPLDNQLLASLPPKDFGALVPHLTTSLLPQGQVVHEAGAEVDYVYFPHGGMFSLLAVMRDGKTVENPTLGREGVGGALGGLRPYPSPGRPVGSLPPSG